MQTLGTSCIWGGEPRILVRVLMATLNWVARTGCDYLMLVIITEATGTRIVERVAGEYKIAYCAFWPSKKSFFVSRV